MSKPTDAVYTMFDIFDRNGSTTRRFPVPVRPGVIFPDFIVSEYCVCCAPLLFFCTAYPDVISGTARVLECITGDVVIRTAAAAAAAAGT